MTKPKCTGEIDQKYWTNGNLVIGVDEAGRGPLAGDMFVGAVCFAPYRAEYPFAFEHISQIGLNDSKKLNSKRRFLLEGDIKLNSLAYAVRRVTVKSINKGESLQALLEQCVKVAIKDVTNKLNIPEKSDNLIILIDGNEINNLPYKQLAQPKMDTVSWSVAAASILAKNAQVRAMQKWHEIYPQYKFNEHNGYGTDLHRSTIVEHGLCDVHRRSWLTEDKIKKWGYKAKPQKRRKLNRQRPKQR